MRRLSMKIQDLTDHIPSRITRADGTADKFVLSGSACSSQFCSESDSKGEGQNDGHPCMCQCPNTYPIFQDDISTCVQQIPESGGCPNTALTDGKKQEITPVVQLPPFGHTINRKINMKTTDVDIVSQLENRCYVEEAQFLSFDGWTSFAAIRLGNQPPRLKLVQQSFPPVAPPLPLSYQSQGDSPSPNWIFYNLQWLGSSEHAEFLQGRIILLTITCNTTALSPVSWCFPMRIAGTFTRLRTLPLLSAGGPHHEGDHVETGVLVAAACGGALGILYVIVLAVFITSRLRKSRKSKQQSDQRPPSHYDVAVDGEDLEKSSVSTQELHHITDPKHEYNTRSYAPWPEDMAFRYRLMQLRSRGLGSLPIRYVYSPPPFFLNDVVIIQTPDVVTKDAEMHDVIKERLESKTLPKPPVRRRKLFFDPRYFDAEHLKHPTVEAEQFRAQIHCMINVTKSRLDKRRFLPNLEMINEESLARRSGTTSPDGTVDFYYADEMVRSALRQCLVWNLCILLIPR
ncbi:uncharacterized protein LOC129588066 isoform X2 [Paramacrobiotus metropolitanus]|uniref:uncharacterized protein LOC129588066 isoform X2 n=1 Tax=Paramacrobiotus metropolitanus TaxID=2943436 RepID=UPI002445F3D7|nr:uncharacterized protein LOC129588066 isoform X2 [Paramacrobiotus metropolitanus]